MRKFYSVTIILQLIALGYSAVLLSNEIFDIFSAILWFVYTSTLGIGWLANFLNLYINKRFMRWITIIFNLIVCLVLLLMVFISFNIPPSVIDITLYLLTLLSVLSLVYSILFRKRKKINSDNYT